jgi:hypothetical protein
MKEHSKKCDEWGREVVSWLQTVANKEATDRGRHTKASSFSATVVKKLR